MIKILITGAGGFIGNHLFNYLKKNKNVKVYGTISKSKNQNKKLLKPKNLKKNIFKADLSNSKEVKKILKKIKPSIIFHFAAMVDHTYAEKNKKLCIKNNTKITKNIINYINKKDKIIFLSTDKIYSQNPKKSPEHTNLSPQGFLAKEKLKCERMIKKKITRYFILRLPIVHANGQSKNFSIIDNFLFSLKKKKKINVFSNVKRSFLKINELMTFLQILIFNKNYGIYNTGSKLFSYSQRLKKLCKKNKISSRKISEVKGKIYPLTQAFYTSKLKNTFGISFS
jgi:dTDP-4-dehydrorhamnose reductase